MAMYQREIANAVTVPVISSALVLLPLIHAALNSCTPVGVITGHSSLLSQRHLGENAKCPLQGMENEPHFREVVIDGAGVPDRTLMSRDLISAAAKLRRDHGDIGAFLLECSNLASCSRELYEAYRIPVFDINDAIRFVYNSLCKPCYCTKTSERS
jgi:hypothetical protein